MEPLKQTTGWQIRCLRCDFAEPWNISGARRKSGARRFVFGRCPQCKRIRFRVIEKVPQPHAPQDIGDAPAGRQPRPARGGGRRRLSPRRHKSK